MRIPALHAVILLACSPFLPICALAGSATWNLDPPSNDWETGANWTPNTVPDQTTDIATFDISNVTDVTEFPGVTIGGMLFNTGASAYTMSISGGLYGSGITNDSGLVQNIIATNSLGFFAAASAGSNVVISSLPGTDSIVFLENSNAGTATIISSGDSADENAVELRFWDQTSAAESSIVNAQGYDDGGRTLFYDSSTAANSTITTESGGFMQFSNTSTAANATLILDGGELYFLDRSTGGLSEVELTNGGLLNVGSHQKTAPMTIGSLEGDGTVELGAQQLTVGGNGLSTTFSGVIAEGGSLIKTGVETLTLAGANTYSGGTTVTAGTLLVQARSGSATGTGAVKVNAGTIGGKGTIQGAVTLGSGAGTGAFLAPSVGVNQPASLRIQKALTFKADGTYTCKLNTKNARADQVIAKGVTIATGAQFDFQPVANKKLTNGGVFTVISNTAATPIAGIFANLPDGSTFTTGRNNYQVSYEGGDGNDLTLTALP